MKLPFGKTLFPSSTEALPASGAPWTVSRIVQMVAIGDSGKAVKKKAKYCLGFPTLSLILYKVSPAKLLLRMLSSKASHLMAVS